MIVSQIAEYLNGLPLGEPRHLGSLRHLSFVIGADMVKALRYAKKDQVVSTLCDYFSAPNRFEQLWNSLSEGERKIVALHVWSGGTEPTGCADEIAAEFGIEDKRERGSLYIFYGGGELRRFKEKYTQNDSPLWLLFPQNSGEWIFSDALRVAVGPMIREYAAVPDEYVFTSREHRTADFANVVRFCNSNKFTITKNGALSKASALKLWNFCGYEEYVSDFNAKPEDVRTAHGLLVTFPLTMLCATGGLIASSEGTYIPGGKSLSLLSLPHEQLVKRLFDSYIKSRSFNETEIIRGIKSKRGHNPAQARQGFISELSLCPPGQAIYTKDLERYLRIVSYTFARKEEKYVVESGNSYYEYEVDWDQYEHPLIHTILSFLGALGMLDIVWREDENEYVAVTRRVPIAFRINPLGAYVLGMTDSYTAPAEPKTKINGGFTVLPDYTVVIPESADRLKHEMYFERLFTKVSETGEAAIYKLDFETVVRALDSGSGVADLRNYLSASDKPIPENVTRALDDWEKQAGRIRVRQVTILECDDEALLEEVIRYRGMGDFVIDRIAAAVVVDGGATGKIKKVIEKNKRFCNDVL